MDTVRETTEVGRDNGVPEAGRADAEGEVNECGAGGAVEVGEGTMTNFSSVEKEGSVK